MRRVITKAGGIGALTAATLAGALLCGGPSHAAANFPRSSDQADRSVRRRRAAGRRGAHHRRLSVGTSRPGGGRKPRRRRRHARGPAVATSPPDGYTLLAGDRRIAVDQPAALQGCRHRSGQAVSPRSPWSRRRRWWSPFNRRFPAHSVKELIAYAKANPGKFNYGAVIGTPPHLSRRNVQAHHRHQYRVRALQDRVTGHHRRVGRSHEHDVRGHHRDRAALSSPAKCGALAVTSPQRIPEIPNVPTMDELGYPGMPPDSWQAIVAPAGTPAAVVAKINAVGEQGLATPELQQKIMTPWRRAAAEVGCRILPPSSPISTSAGARLSASPA